VLAFFISMDIPGYYKIGYIAKTHGLRGEVTSVFENNFELHKADLIFIELDGGLVPYCIEHASDRGDKTFLKLDGIDTLDQASVLKGHGVYVAKANRPKLKRGLFYDDEVLGFYAEDEIVGPLGKVLGVQRQGMNKLLVILTEKGEILVPIHSPLIKSINKSQQRIKLNLPEGYLEI